VPLRPPVVVASGASFQIEVAPRPPRKSSSAGVPEPLRILEEAGQGMAAITQAIAGLGGVGKSQLMLHFAHRRPGMYDITWWVRVDEALAEDFLALGRALGLVVDGIDQAAAMQQVRTWLNGTERRWLLL
jgi:hypothetical protein